MYTIKLVITKGPQHHVLSKPRFVQFVATDYWFKEHSLVATDNNGTVYCWKDHMLAHIEIHEIEEGE